MPSNASKLDLINAALALIGDDEIASLSDDGEREQLANAIYDLRLEEALGVARWRFAMRQVVLVRNTTAPLGRWDAAYDLPDGTTAIYADGDPEPIDITAVTVNGNTIRFDRYGQQIYCNASGSDEVLLDYKFVPDEEDFTPRFRGAFIDQLAADFLRPKDDEAAERMQRQSERKFKLAAGLESQERTARSLPVHSFTRARKGWTAGNASSLPGKGGGAGGGGKVHADGVVFDDSSVGYSAADTQAALEKENDARLAHIGDTANPHSVTKAQVGLGNVTNDAQAKQSANLSDLDSASAARGNLGLGALAVESNAAGVPFDDSSMSYSAADVQAALEAEESARQAHEGDGTNPHGVTKTQVGLGNVTNDAQLKQAANLSDLANPATARNNIGLGNVSNDAQLTIVSNLADLGNAETARKNLGIVPTRAWIAANNVPANIGRLIAGGHTTEGDGGHAIWLRVGAEPSHAFKVQSADGAWWEGLPEAGRVYAEQFGAINDGAADDHAALTDALDYAKSTKGTLVAKGKYRIDSTLVYPAGRFGFEGPDVREIETGIDRGFIWGGGNNDVMVEIETMKFSRITSLVVNNRVNKKTGMTGVLVHNEAGAAGASINHNDFGFVGLFGVNVGLQIGDFTNDGYDSNCDDLVFENLIFYEAANPVVIDSADSDNVVFQRLVSGGPQSSLGAYVGTREHIIHVKRCGNGLRVMDGFARMDDIVTDNAAVLVEDGTFSCDYFSFEGAVTASLIHLDASRARDTSVLQKVIAPEHIKDSSGRAMRLNSTGGVVLIGCAVGGDIEVNDDGVTAFGTTFTGGSADFVSTSGDRLAKALTGGTTYRASDGSALDPRASRVHAGALIPHEFETAQSGNVFPNLDRGTIFPVDLSANASVQEPSSVNTVKDIGREIEFRITDDGSGPHSVTWNAAFKLAGGSYTHSGAGKTDILRFRFDGTVWWECQGRATGMS